MGDVRGTPNDTVPPDGRPSLRPLYITEQFSYRPLHYERTYRSNTKISFICERLHGCILFYFCFVTCYRRRDVRAAGVGTVPMQGCSAPADHGAASHPSHLAYLHAAPVPGCVQLLTSPVDTHSFLLIFVVAMLPATLYDSASP